MSSLPLEELERASTSWNPLLKTRLRPGLPESDVRRALKRAGVTGLVDLLVALYTWRDGTILDSELALSRIGFFPFNAYYFVSLEYALSYLRFFKAAAKSQPKLSEAVGRYLPIFWDGSTKWIALDLQSSGEIFTIDLNAERPFHWAYDSLEGFLADVIRASEQNNPLTCFQTEALE